MAVEIDQVAYGIAALVLVLFAGWLLYLSPRQRATRALSTLLVSIASAWMLDGIARFFSLGVQVASLYLYPVILSVLSLSTVYFVSVYPRPRGWIGRSPWGARALIGIVAAVALVVAVAPELWATPVIVEGELAAIEEGPLNLITNLWTVTIAILLILLALDHARAPAGPQRRAITLIIAAFMASSLVWQASLVLNDLGRRITAEALSPPILRATYLIDELALLGTLAAPAILLASSLRSRDETRRREAFGVALVALVAIAACVLVWAFAPPPRPGEWIGDAQSVVDAAGGVVIALFAGYALLKHRLFDIDVKLKWTIRRGTVAAVFVAVFFAVSQAAQNFLTESYGWMTGGIVAGLLLFAIAPLQRMADRVASVAMPAVHDRGSITPDRRAEFYRTALAMALSDGFLTRDEERHLAQLAEQLALSHTEALRLREEVEAGLLVRNAAGASAEA